MPSYDLQCTQCGARFEVFRQGFLRDEDRVCSCGASADQLFTGFVTARPATPTPTRVTGFGSGHGGGCSCCGGGGAGSRAEWTAATGGD